MERKPMTREQFIKRMEKRQAKRKENRKEWLSLILFFAMCFGVTWIASAIAMMN